MTRPRERRFGRTLEQARIATGLSLEEAAAATHISPRYLRALEEEDVAELPAPIYAKGFLRAYAQYLGLDPSHVVTLYPVPYQPPALEPLPRVHQPPSRAISWAIIGAIVLVLGLTVILFATSRGGGGVATQAPDAGSLAAEGSGEAAAPAVLPEPTVSASGPLPEFVGQPLEDVLPQLARLGVNYVVVQVPSSEPEGLVIAQDPTAGTEMSEISATLTVSEGPTPTAEPSP